MKVVTARAKNPPLLKQVGCLPGPGTSLSIGNIFLDKPNTSALSDTCILNSGCAESSSTGANKKYAKKQSSTPGNSKTEIKKGIKQKIVNKVMSWNNSKAASSKSFVSINDIRF